MKIRAIQPKARPAATPRATQRQIRTRRASHTEGARPAVTTRFAPIARKALVSFNVTASVSTAASVTIVTRTLTVRPVSQGRLSLRLPGFRLGRGGVDQEDFAGQGVVVAHGGGQKRGEPVGELTAAARHQDRGGGVFRGVGALHGGHDLGPFVERGGKLSRDLEHAPVQHLLIRAYELRPLTVRAQFHSHS
jgi:hypothetical protein